MRKQTKNLKFKVSRHRSFTATKSKETRNKKRTLKFNPYFCLMILVGYVVAMIKPKVGVKLLYINYLMPESLVFSCAKTLFLVSLLFLAVKDRSLLIF